MNPDYRKASVFMASCLSLSIIASERNNPVTTPTQTTSFIISSIINDTNDNLIIVDPESRPIKKIPAYSTLTFNLAIPSIISSQAAAAYRQAWQTHLHRSQRLAAMMLCAINDTNGNAIISVTCVKVVNADNSADIYVALLNQTTGETKQFSHHLPDKNEISVFQIKIHLERNHEGIINFGRNTTVTLQA